MKAAVIWTGDPDEGALRRLLAAAGETGAGQVEAWLFSKAAVEIANLPVTEIVNIPGEGPWLAERLVPPLSILFSERQPDILLFHNGTFSNATAVRLAHAVGAKCALSVEKFIPKETGLSLHRRILGMNLLGEFVCQILPLVVSVSTGSYDPIGGEAKPKITTTNLSYGGSEWCSNYRESENTARETLADRDLILVGGRGIGGEKGMNELRELGELMNGGVGSTRPVALDGCSPLENIIGVSGLSVSPKLCLTFGTSGSTPFIKGIEKSDCIIAVNNDPEAMVFNYSHFGIVGDCASILSHLKSLIRSSKTDV